MDAKEKEQWRLLGAMLAMNGLVSSGFTGADLPVVSFKISDDMLEQAEQNIGITAIRKRNKK
jgi:hypothetical protein